jgi:hypothetical protein
MQNKIVRTWPRHPGTGITGSRWAGGTTIHDGYRLVTAYGHPRSSAPGNYVFEHEVVDHAVEYVRGEVHTNGLENFWSLVKRGLKGTYVSVEPFHLFRYLDEQVFRYNHRKMNDGDRFNIVVREIVGKRLTWDRLTGKAEILHSLQVRPS